MMHSGDTYEIRARLERHRELRRLTRIVGGFLFRTQAREPKKRPFPYRLGCANDGTLAKGRAA
ncbi:MAG: hypothetical protein Tsb0019_36230 [Roseibium sp.]